MRGILEGLDHTLLWDARRMKVRKGDLEASSPEYGRGWKGGRWQGNPGSRLVQLREQDMASRLKSPQGCCRCICWGWGRALSPRLAGCLVEKWDMEQRNARQAWMHRQVRGLGLWPQPTEWPLEGEDRFIPAFQNSRKSLLRPHTWRLREEDSGKCSSGLAQRGANRCIFWPSENESFSRVESISPERGCVFPRECSLFSPSASLTSCGIWRRFPELRDSHISHAKQRWEERALRKIVRTEWDR